ncbi:MAG: hypothetical protein ACRDKI_03825 [Solirubrobacterales bacterium]
MSTTAFEMFFADATLDQYDQVLEKMGFQDGIGPEHALFHWVAEVDGGIKVVDLWDSPAAFEQFAATSMGPLTAEVGIGEPLITTYEVHNTLVGQDVLATAKA